MEHYIIGFALVVLSGCGGGGGSNATSDKSLPLELTGQEWIVAGQSNAARCDWGYLERLTGATITNIAVGGKTIDVLIGLYEYKPHNAQGILFVHGGSDAITNTAPGYYVERVEYYRLLIGDLPFYVSSVGYGDYWTGISDIGPDNIRAAVNDNEYGWVVAYDDAQYFRDWGMLLPDGVHFTEEGCRLMMDGMIKSIHEKTTKAGGEK